jgi:hypothetical protein
MTKDVTSHATGTFVAGIGAIVLYGFDAPPEGSYGPHSGTPPGSPELVFGSIILALLIILVLGVVFVLTLVTCDRVVDTITRRDHSNSGSHPVSVVLSFFVAAIVFVAICVKLEFVAVAILIGNVSIAIAILIVLVSSVFAIGAWIRDRFW